MKHEDFYNHWSSFVKNHPERKAPTHCFVSRECYMDLLRNSAWREFTNDCDDCDFVFRNVKCFIVKNKNCPITMVRM